MEVGGAARGRRSTAGRGGEQRDSTERKPCMAMKRVQVVYYLTRNGQLEHPHFMELSHSPNHLLRLKDFVDRLTALRGRGMPSLYSWSCKRTYKNGYVWNDLGENDAIYPADGAAAEYVLKGSEILPQPVAGFAERLPPPPQQQIHDVSSSRDVVVHNHQPRTTNYQPLAKTKQRLQQQQPLEFTAPLPPRTRPCSRELEPEPEEEEEEKSPEELDEEEKASYSTTSSTTPRSRCSRGVYTDEPEEEQQQAAKQGNQLVPTHTQKTPLILVKRFPGGEEGDGGSDSDPGSIKESSSSATRPAVRNSVLLQLISCGSFTAPPPPKLKTNAAATIKKLPLPPPVIKREVVGSSDDCGAGNVSSRRMGSTGNGAGEEGEGEEEEAMMMIKYMSENPRFGNPQSQDKEFFSGSIVESVDHPAPPGIDTIKRSNSYGEQRSSLKEAAAHVEDAAAEAGAQVKNRGGGGGIKGKCMPRLRSSK
ncbi:unnamed protein product [Linum trigynum]|uniref:SOSEKI DIX-like domain-containing protein n=1 Tax=Linum trigynum TaxID=586398 RepID=A0AAV2DSN5_9ROSI